MTEEKKDIQPKKRTGRKIVSRIFGSLLILLLAGFLALQSPAVQTWIARRALERITRGLDGEITFESLNFRPLQGFTVKGLVVRDRHPYRSEVPGVVPAPDTLARIGSLSATFNLLSLLDDDYLAIRTAHVRDVEVNLVRTPDSLSSLNILRVFGLDESDEDEEELNLVTCKTLHLKNVRLRYLDYGVLETRALDSLAAPETGTDWADLRVTLDLSANNVSLLEDTFSADIRSLRAFERGGLAVDPFSGRLNVGPTETTLSDAILADAHSRIDIRRLLVSYENGMEDLEDPIGSVPFELELGESVLDLESAVPASVSLHGRRFHCRLTGKVEGTVDELHIPMLHLLSAGSGLSAVLTGRISGLPNPEAVRCELSVNNLRASAAGIDETVSGLIPGEDLRLRKTYHGGPVVAALRASGTLDRLLLRGSVRDNRGGRLILDGNVEHLLSAKPIQIDGQIGSSRLHLGRILGIDDLGELTFTSRLSAALKNSGPEAKIYSLEISRLEFAGYPYSCIYATGILGRNSYKGSIVSRDPNLDFLFGGQITLPTATRNGKYAFTADVALADLSALHLDSRETAQVDFRLIADYIETPDGDFRGDIHIRNLNLLSDTGIHHAGNISVRSTAAVNDHRIDLTARFATASFQGTRPVTRFVRDLFDASLRKDLPTLFGEPENPDGGNGRYRVDFLLGNTREILPFFVPGMYVAENTRLALQLEEDGALDGQLTSDGLIHEGLFAKNLEIDFDNTSGYLAASGTADEAGYGEDITLRDNVFAVYSVEDAVDLRYRSDIVGADPGDRADLHLRAFISRDEEVGDPIITGDIPASEIVYLGIPWDIRASQFRYRALEEDLGVDGFAITSGGQALKAGGRLCPGDDALMHLRLQDLDMSILNRLSGLGLDLQGRLSGRAELLSPYTSMPNITAQLMADNTSIAGHSAGRITFDSEWEEAEERFRLDLRDSRRTFMGDGYLYPKNGWLDASLVFNGFQIGYVAPVVTDAFSDFEGRLSGELGLKGPVDDFQLTGRDLTLADVLLQVDYTDVPYFVDGPLLVSGQQMRFDKLNIRDRYDGTAKARGGIYFDHFNTFRYDIDFDMKQMEAIDLGKKQNELFYGNLFASGAVTVGGDLDRFGLDIDARTVRSGSIHIPFDYTTDASTGDLLRFLEPEKPVRINPLDSILTRRRAERSTPMDIDVDIRVAASPDAQIFIDLDPATGNVLSARGEGTMDIGYHKDDFTMNGDYTVSSGNYHFSAIVASRDFDITSGSKVHFNGDIYDSDLDINARYSTRASLAPLIGDTTSTRVPVECKIAIGDKLRNPSVNLSIDIPQLDPTTQGLVSGALNTQDNIQRQFLSLLVSGSFLPTEQSSVVNSNSNLLFSNVSAIMSDQLNNILANLGIPLDLGLNYQSTDAGNDLFDVAISTQLFNDRVIVNGSVGNRPYSSAGTNTTEVAGDLDIAVKLNKSGSVRATFFSHSTDQYTNYLDTSQRNGAGFSYQKEFSTFGAFFRSLFQGQGWHSSAEKIATDGEQVEIVITVPDDSEK